MGLKIRQRVGQYRIEERLADGGFAAVFRALDTVEGIPVALKVPHREFVTKEALESFRKEVRLTARLDHPNVLPIKTAGFVEGRFMIVTPLGLESLAQRLMRRMSRSVKLQLAGQLLEALACAHRVRIVHCDIKPENLILFPGNRLRLADFGLARVIQRTHDASGSGTVGYLAPEQALGRPSMRSDVFSSGLVISRMLTGRLFEWPFQWPPAGFASLKEHIHPDFELFLRKSLYVDDRERYPSGVQMLQAFRRVEGRALSPKGGEQQARVNGFDWKELHLRRFRHEFGKPLAARHECKSCHGPVSEVMRKCPWCGASNKIARGDVKFPATCPRCHCGLKLDWRYCPWCYGKSVGPVTSRSYSDRRYERHCNNKECNGQLMPFMRYCPWCRRKVAHKWKIGKRREACPGCGWGVLRDYWKACPWCAKALKRN